MVIVATLLLLLIHVPPTSGNKLVILSIQIDAGPSTLEVGLGDIVTVRGNEVQPVVVSVNVKVEVPADIPDIKPALVIVATEGVLLIHVPPVAGATVVVKPTQIVFGPEKLTVGLLLTVTGAVGSDAQPPVAVKIKVAVPALTAVTTPPLVTVATPVLLLAHVPPVVGDKVVEVPIQIKLAPVILTVGLFVTVIGAVGSDVQPVVDEVNVNVAVPTPTPVTSPLLATVATPALLLCHVPPVVGDN